MKKIIIYHHLGLGDHIHCNGLIRTILKINYNSEIYIFTRSKIKKMVSYMYRDQKKIKLIIIPNFILNEDNYVFNFLKKKKFSKFYKIGFDYIKKNFDQINKNLTVDQLFYKQMNISYKNRYNKTYWKRDFDKENKLYNKLVKNRPYVFIHDDKNRGFSIPDDLIKPQFNIIRNNPKYSIFDYGLILENAAQIHLMESSIRCMLETLKPKKCKFYLYHFKKMDHFKSIPFYKKKKIIGSRYRWKYINLNFKLPLKSKIENIFIRIRLFILKKLIFMK